MVPHLAGAGLQSMEIQDRPVLPYDDTLNDFVADTGYYNLRYHLIARHIVRTAPIV